MNLGGDILFGMATKKKSENAVVKNMEIPAALNIADVPSVYSNGFELLSMNHIDIRLGFNEVLIDSGNQVKTLRRANVVMPIPAFMIMLQLLNANAKMLMEVGQQQAKEQQAQIESLIKAGLAQAQQTK